MIQQPGFDNEKYIKEQTTEILKRVDRFNNKLYLEFGGKLLFDYHAARVLPGYDPNVKMRLIRELKDEADIILCIYAGDIERKKIRADFGITYDADALKLIDNLRTWGINVLGVVITRFDEQPAAIIFKNKLERRDIPVYTHRFTKGYPTDVEMIVSDDGYGANTYIKTNKPLVIVTGPGPGSGKMATCLSQLYHDYRQGVNSGYAKFETFPIWNIPLKHPVNVLTLLILFILTPTEKSLLIIIATWKSFLFCGEFWKRLPGRNLFTNLPLIWESTAPGSLLQTMKSRKKRPRWK
jgi:uncharacterized protein (UPF0371 family)